MLGFVCGDNRLQKCGVLLRFYILQSWQHGLYTDRHKLGWRGVFHEAGNYNNYGSSGDHGSGSNNDDLGDWDILLNRKE